MHRLARRSMNSGLILAMTAAGLALASSPADAAITPVPELPKNLVVFPERDFMVLEGYPGGVPVRVEVVRDGIVIGTARVTTSAGDPSAEVNHPGGACWLGVTPDLLPGDVVRAVEGTDAAGEPVGQGTHVIDVDAEAAVVEGTDVVVRGTARDATGAPIPIDLLEQRIINPDMVSLPEIGRRDIRATSDGAGRGTFSYDAPGSTHWTARYTGLSARARELAVEGQTRIMSWQQAAPDGERAGLTIYEVGEANGPGMAECPPGAEYAINDTTPTAVNATNVGNTDLVVSGTSHKASNVAVTLSDGTSTLTARTVPEGAEFQSWSAKFAAADVAALKDGTLQLEARYTLADGTIGGRDRTVLKDTVAPTAAPVANPGAGTFADPVDVTLTAEADTRIHVTLDGSGADRRDPVMESVRITSDTTLRAVAIDAAGNRSPELSAAYVVGTRTGEAEDAGPATADPAPAPRSVSEPPRIPQNVVAFPSRDFVVAEGYGAGEQLTFRVIRNGVVVGESVGTSSGGDPSAEVNHPGGTCWIGSTPDLRAGDVVQVLTDTTPGFEQGDSTTVRGVHATAAVIEGDTVVVRGTAMGADGNRLPIELLEQRIINPDLTETSIGRRDLRATSDGAGNGILAWDDPADPTNGAWTATYSTLSPEVRDLAVAGQTRIMGWQAVVGAERAGLTIFEVGEVGGPGMGGCPTAAPYAVTSSSVPAVTAAFAGGNQPLVVHGVTGGSAPSAVRLADANGSVDGEVLASSGGGTWSASFPAAAVTALADGPLTVSADFGDITGRSMTIQKDTVVPAAPVASPGSGTYRANQSVTLSTPAEKGLAIHFTTDNEKAGPDDARYTGAISVTEGTTTLRAVAVDEVGNPSAEAAFVYRIQLPPLAIPGDLALDAASDSGTAGDGLTNDRTPTFTGSAPSGTTVELLVNGVVAASGTATNGAFSLTAGSALADGTYEVRARARDAGRTGELSAPFTLKVDATAPSVTITSGPTGSTNNSSPSFGFTATEGAATQCSPANLGAGFVSCTSPASYGPLPDGAYTFRARATDAAGNVSAERSRAFTVDTTAVPAPTPTVSLPTNGQVQATNVPVRVNWAGTTSTDLLRYELHILADGGSPTTFALTDPRATTALVPLAPGTTSWSFQLTTVDQAGNRRSATSRSFVLTAAQESSSAITWNPAPTTTRWRLAALAGAYGGSVRWDSTAGATATYSFTGNGVQWIAATGPDRGRADVFLDGVRVAAGIELHSDGTQTRRVMFARSGLTDGNHTLQVRVTGQKLGKSKGTRVDVDAFISTR